MRLFRHHRQRSWFAHWMLRRFGRKLRLDERQQQQLQALQDKMHAVGRDMKQARRDTHRDVEKLFSAERLDREAAKRLLAVPRHALEERVPEMVDGFADFFDQLDGTQRQRLLSLWQRHQHRHGMFA